MFTYPYPHIELFRWSWVNAYGGIDHGGFGIVLNPFVWGF